MPESINAYELPERHAGVLLDAYGVLVNRAGVLPGAIDFIAHLNARDTPYAILTNASSRRTDDLAAFLQGFGLPIPTARIVSSGSLVPDHFRGHALAGARTFVIGTEASRQFVLDGGGVIAPLDAAEVILVTDQCGFPFLETLDATLNHIIHAHERGASPHLICCNPDLIYPTTDTEFGFTAGSVAGLLAHALEERYGDGAPRFQYLGKPYAPIFDAGRRLCGSDDLVMVGDQPSTDILGANRAGLASALIASRHAQTRSDIATPDYRLHSLQR